MFPDAVSDTGSELLDGRNYCERFGRGGTMEQHPGLGVSALPRRVQSGKDLRRWYGGEELQLKRDGFRRQAPSPR
jgi:hypothetical protein